VNAKKGQRSECRYLIPCERIRSGFNLDQNPVFYLDTDPDPGAQTNADPNPDPGQTLHEKYA
jgi:hypothetical protein